MQQLLQKCRAEGKGGVAIPPLELRPFERLHQVWKEEVCPTGGGQKATTFLEPNYS